MKGRPQSQQMLRLLFWESTIKCNLNCVYCRRLESNEAVGADLSTLQAKRLIEQLAQLGSEQRLMPVLVFSGGEPLCRDDIFELVEYAGTFGLVPAIATNGTMISAETVQRIADSRIARVAVSLDSATAEVHNKLRQLEGAFKKALAGIKRLGEKNVPFQINVTLTKQNAGQLTQVYELAQSLGAAAVHIFMLVPVGCGRVLSETDMLSPQEYEQKLVEICQLDSMGKLQVKVTCAPHYERIIREHGLYQSRMKTDQSRHGSAVDGSVHDGFLKGCLAGSGVLFVGHQGDVSACGYLPVKCGNIKQQNLLQIWCDSDDLAMMRDRDALEGKCGYCNYRVVCGGCRARAYAVTGNYMAEEPFCSYIPPALSCDTTGGDEL